MRKWTHSSYVLSDAPGSHRFLKQRPHKDIRQYNQVDYAWAWSFGFLLAKNQVGFYSTAKKTSVWYFSSLSDGSKRLLEKYRIRVPSWSNNDLMADWLLFGSDTITTPLRLAMAMGNHWPFPNLFYIYDISWWPKHLSGPSRISTSELLLLLPLSLPRVGLYPPCLLFSFFYVTTGIK